MTSRLPNGFAFQCVVFGLAAVGVRYVGAIFTTSTRWALVVLLLVIVAEQGELKKTYSNKMFKPLICYFLWILCTVFWSEIAILTILKAVAYIVTISALVSGGLYWVRVCGTRAPISYLLPVVPLTLAAGLLGSDGSTTNGGEQIDAGLSGNPNYLGLLVAVSIPCMLYYTYRALQNRSATNISKISIAGVLVVMCIILYRSGSRSSLLCALVVMGAFTLTAFPRRIMPVIVIASMIAVGFAVIASSVTDSLYQSAAQFIIKSNPDNGVFFSRAAVFQADYNGALAGGIAGVGFGVDAGETGFTPGLTSEFYGRLKGNSQLGVIEGTGLIGLSFYIFLLVQICHGLIRRASMLEDRDLKIQLSLCLGLMGGLLVQSIFEAWWASPGSPEAAVFWATMGVAVGITQQKPLQPQLDRGRGVTKFKKIGEGVLA